MVIAGARLAATVLQVKGDQACPAGAATAPCQQGGDGPPENGHGAAVGHQEPIRMQRAGWVLTAPAVHCHLEGGGEEHKKMVEEEEGEEGKEEKGREEEAERGK